MYVFSYKQEGGVKLKKNPIAISDFDSFIHNDNN